jgi:hypothetical protein
MDFLKKKKKKKKLSQTKPNPAAELLTFGRERLILQIESAQIYSVVFGQSLPFLAW